MPHDGNAYIDLIFMPGEGHPTGESCPDCGWPIQEKIDWDTGEKYLECTCIFCTHKELINN